jgi:hypothetical protein
LGHGKEKRGWWCPWPKTEKRKGEKEKKKREGEVSPLLSLIQRQREKKREKGQGAVVKKRGGHAISGCANILKKSACAQVLEKNKDKRNRKKN